MRYTNCFDKERRDFLKVVKHAGISAGLLQASSLLAGVMSRVTEVQSGAGISGNRVLDAGGMSQVNLYQTIGLKLRADQSPGGAAYRDWGVSTIASL